MIFNQYFHHFSNRNSFCRFCISWQRLV